MQYKRKYFALPNGIRLTMDYDMQFATTIHNATTPSPVYCVLEIKFDTEKRDEAAQIMQDLGYRYYRHSKYVIGIDTLYL